MTYTLELTEKEVEVLSEVFVYGTQEVIEKHFEELRMAPLEHPTRQAVESLGRKASALDKKGHPRSY